MPDENGGTPTGSGRGNKPKPVDPETYAQDSKLIESVKQREGLYSSGVGCKDMQLREELNQLWKEVANETDIPAAQCKARWGQLRNVYRIKMTAYESSGREAYKMWTYYKQMTFLDKYIQYHRKLKITPAKSTSSKSTTSGETTATSTRAPSRSATTSTNSSSKPNSKPLPSRKRDRPRKLKDYVSNEYMSQLEIAEKERLKVKLRNKRRNQNVNSQSDSSDSDTSKQEESVQREGEGDDSQNSGSEDNLSVNGDNTVIIVYDDTFEGGDEEEEMEEGEEQSGEEGEEEEASGQENSEDEEVEEQEEEGEEQEDGDDSSSNDSKADSDNEEQSSPADIVEPPRKQGRGRPRKYPIAQPRPPAPPLPLGMKRKVGRPRKYDTPPKPPKPPLIINGVVVKRKRGRPRKEVYSPSRNPIKTAQGYGFPQGEAKEGEERLLVTVTDMRGANRVFCKRITINEATKLQLDGFNVYSFLGNHDHQYAGGDSKMEKDVQEVPVIEETREVDEVPLIEPMEGSDVEKEAETVELSEVPGMNSISHQLTEEEITQGFTCHEFVPGDQLEELG